MSVTVVPKQVIVCVYVECSQLYPFLWYFLDLLNIAKGLISAGDNDNIAFEHVSTMAIIDDVAWR